MRHYKLTFLALAASSCLATLPAAAQTGGASAPRGADSSVSFGYPVGTQSLEVHRGGDIGVASSTLAGTTANNSATDVITGTNSISAGSFSNSAGIPVVVQNSGANVLIQNAVTVNLQMK
ncbi:MAG: hypothetical protein OJF60_003346 [Burkholderiaceae bacterium]|jgi:hypothetical protein|nr:MAG: hypothetical protein OJF60_003346 [Burkholderiaceae bacterium]